MPMMTPSRSEVEAAKARTLSADHVFFDADGESIILGAGQDLLELRAELKLSKHGFVLKTHVLTIVGPVMMQLWTVGKLVAWERA